MKLFWYSFFCSKNLAAVDLYDTNYGLERFGQPPGLNSVIVEIPPGTAQLTEGMTASVRKIRKGIPHDERAESGKALPQRSSGSSGVI
jgi:hypothetical protein